MDRLFGFFTVLLLAGTSFFLRFEIGEHNFTRAVGKGRFQDVRVINVTPGYL